jgi:hypothetical protein
MTILDRFFAWLSPMQGIRRMRVRQAVREQLEQAARQIQYHEGLTLTERERQGGPSQAWLTPRANKIHF